MELSNIFYSDSLAYAGFHTRDTQNVSSKKIQAIMGKRESDYKARPHLKVMNFMNVLGWIPIIGGIIAGVMHIARARHLKYIMTKDGRQNEFPNPNLLIARGVAEIAGLGPLLMVIDIIVTVGRMTTKPKKPVTS